MGQKAMLAHLNVSRRLDIRGAESEIFFNVRNLFDMEAPLYTAGAPSPGSSSAARSRPGCGSGTRRVGRQQEPSAERHACGQGRVRVSTGSTRTCERRHRVFP